VEARARLVHPAIAVAGDVDAAVEVLAAGARGDEVPVPVHRVLVAPAAAREAARHGRMRLWRREAVAGVARGLAGSDARPDGRVRGVAIVEAAVAVGGAGRARGGEPGVLHGRQPGRVGAGVARDRHRAVEVARVVHVRRLHVAEDAVERLRDAARGGDVRLVRANAGRRRCRVAEGVHRRRGVRLRAVAAGTGGGPALAAVVAVGTGDARDARRRAFGVAPEACGRVRAGDLAVEVGAGAIRRPRGRVLRLGVDVDDAVHVLAGRGEHGAGVGDRRRMADAARPVRRARREPGVVRDRERRRRARRRRIAVAASAGGRSGDGPDGGVRGVAAAEAPVAVHRAAAARGRIECRGERPVRRRDRSPLDHGRASVEVARRAHGQGLHVAGAAVDGGGERAGRDVGGMGTDGGKRLVGPPGCVVRGRAGLVVEPAMAGGAGASVVRVFIARRGPGLAAGE